MSSIGRLAGVTLDTTDPEALAGFYIELTGWQKLFGSADFTYIGSEDGANRMGFQRVTDHVAPVWPSQDKQMHLDFSVEDLDKAEQRLVELGATKPEFQPAPDKWRVLQDPAGHPFCITNLV